MKRVVVLGGADGVWEEFERASTLFTPDEIVAVNNAGRDYSGFVHHWCTLHPELFSLWEKQRSAKGYPLALNRWTGNAPGYWPDIKRGRVHSGSSGRLGVDIAQLIGATHIVLCGIPLSPEAEHYDKPGSWEAGKTYREQWLNEHPIFKPVTRSMSGWTRDLLGEPTEKWLARKHKIEAATVNS